MKIRKRDTVAPAVVSSLRSITLHSAQYVSVPKSVAIFTILIVLLLISLVTILFFPWQQSSIGTGRVLAYAPDDRTQMIQSPVEGRIGKWYVLEGSTIKAGEPIVDIIDIDPQIMTRLRTELEAAEQKIAVAEKGLRFSERNLLRQKELAQKGLASQRSYELAELEVAKLRGEVATATSEVAKIQVRLARQASQTITASRDGIIQRIMVMQGSTFVHRGDTIALLVPNTNSRAVELIIDGNDIPLIQIGRHVQLQFEGWPAVQFVGMPGAAVGTFGGTVNVIDPTDDGSGRFRILIIPDINSPLWPDATQLRQGIRVQGWVLLDQVPMWYEIWRRLNGLPLSIRQPYQVENKKTTDERPSKKRSSSSEQKENA